MPLALKRFPFRGHFLINAPLYQNSCDNKTNFNWIRSDFLDRVSENAFGHRLLTRLDVQFVDAHMDHSHLLNGHLVSYLLYRMTFAPLFQSLFPSIDCEWHFDLVIIINCLMEKSEGEWESKWKIPKAQTFCHHHGWIHCCSHRWWS